MLIIKKPVKNKAPEPAPVVVLPKRQVSFNLDQQFQTVVATTFAANLTYTLMASLAYYCFDVSILSDEVYDQACKTLLKGWDTFDHQHKGLFDPESLRAGSLHHLALHNYPNSIRFGLSAITDNTPLQLAPQHKRAIFEAHFCPHEEAWDTYKYSDSFPTWRIYQKEMRKHYSICVHRGTMTPEQFAHTMGSIGAPELKLIDRKYLKF